MTELSKHRVASLILIMTVGFTAGIVVNAVEPYWLGLAAAVAVALLASLTAEFFLRWRRRTPNGE